MTSCITMSVIGVGANHIFTILKRAYLLTVFLQIFINGRLITAVHKFSHHFFGTCFGFTTRCYASAVLAMGLCLSVCLSVTSRSSTKSAKLWITQTTVQDSTGTLVFWRQWSPRNSTGITPCGGAKCRWGGHNRRLSTNNGYISKTVQDRRMVSIKVE